MRLGSEVGECGYVRLGSESAACACMRLGKERVKVECDHERNDLAHSTPKQVNSYI